MGDGVGVLVVGFGVGFIVVGSEVVGSGVGPSVGLELGLFDGDDEGFNVGLDVDSFVPGVAKLLVSLNLNDPPLIITSLPNASS